MADAVCPGRLKLLEERSIPEVDGETRDRHDGGTDLTALFAPHTRAATGVPVPIECPGCGAIHTYTARRIRGGGLVTSYDFDAREDDRR